MRSNPDESWGEASPDTPRQPPDPIGPDPVPPPDPRDPPPYPRYVDVPPTQPVDDGRVVIGATGGAS